MLQNFDMRGAGKIFFILSVLTVLSAGDLLAQGQNGAAAKKDARMLWLSGDYAAAISVCEEEIRLDPERIDAYAVMCWALIDNRQYAEAKQRAADGLRVSQNDLRLIESMGEACYYLGQNAQALDNFQRFVANAQDNNPRIGKAYYFMGEIFLRQTRFQHADIALTVAVQKSPMEGAWWAKLGYAREYAGNYNEALSAYDEALRLDPASVDAGTGKARVSSKMR